MTPKVQSLVDMIHEWTKRWGFELNRDKTKAMLLTRQYVQPQPIHIQNNNIQFVLTPKSLGMLLDAPGLSWRSHVQYIMDSCLPKVNRL